MRIWPSFSVGLAGLLLVSLGAAATPLCARCIDKWTSSVEPNKRKHHTALVKAGKRYEVKLAPSDANADLIVAEDNNFPPELVLCRSARGAKAVDNCSFRATADHPVHVFVLGRYSKTGYDLRVEKTASK